MRWNPFTKKKPVPDTKPHVPKAKKKTAKEIATDAGEPYVAVLGLDLDEENLNEGAFELDWNDKFIANLVRAGYQGKLDEDDHVIIDRWFQNICRHVVMETYEQDDSDPVERAQGAKQKDIGGGRKEMS